MATKTNADIALQREDEVLILRTRDRLQFREIAERLGCDVKNAHEAWVRGRAKQAAAAAAQYGAYVGEQLAIIQEIITGLMPKVRKGDVRAVEGMCRALDHEAKLLGLYAPVKASVTVTDEMTERVKALAEELAGLAD
ncbi:hypothetical protein [Streptomyces sp. RKAG337]|uniref:hypothetical protein n=1 Tax=Streptomyces sp. RKAG337 TaxID=2893404 RepID=UPI0020346136|nr:hypothetical protein [Streptomyces sp. RKAG337]MCM2427375.1 hypothetical protein [Streptomyces sp. RKAG337]